MCDIGLRSGKIRAGLYRCGNYRIERQITDYWLIKNQDGSLKQGLCPFNTLTEAYNFCRYQLKD